MRRGARMKRAKSLDRTNSTSSRPLTLLRPLVAWGKAHLNFYRVHLIAFVFVPLFSAAIFYACRPEIPFVDCLVSVLPSVHHRALLVLVRRITAEIEERQPQKMILNRINRHASLWYSAVRPSPASTRSSSTTSPFPSRLSSLFVPLPRIGNHL